MPIADNDNDTLNFSIIGGIGINITLSGIGTSVNNITPSILYHPMLASIWQSGKEYFVGDLVWQYIGGSISRCTEDHISGSDFNTDLPLYWELILGNSYFKTMGNLYFRLNLFNNTEEVKSFPVNNLTMRTSLTFFGMPYVGAITAYDNNTLQPLVSSITLQAGASDQVIVGVNDFMNRNNGISSTPTAGTRVTPTFNIRYNGEVIASDEFNIEAN